jgi:peptidoglycan/xylan/chitin deacetylase (PgdA/CDA1 family)
MAAVFQGKGFLFRGTSLMSAGIMFHHFHDTTHPPTQGSLSAETFEKMLQFIGLENICSPQQWLHKWERQSLKPGEVCLTFDDNLRCQYDVALPVLRRYNLQAFWFICTATLEAKPSGVELYRAFRHQAFSTMEAFYDAFFKRIFTEVSASQQTLWQRGFQESCYLEEATFCSRADRWFRYVRDIALGEAAYQQTLEAMMREQGIDPQALASNLWMDETCLKTLYQEGHVLGSHSHTHPNRMASLYPEEQREDYAKSQAMLQSITGKIPTALSHPANSYSNETLEMLAGLGFKVGFRATQALSTYSALELPRKDHAFLLKALFAQV